MYCKNCGEKLEDNIKFCAKCGNKCNEKNLVNNTLEKVKKIDKKILIGVGIALVIIILLVSGIFGKRYTKNMKTFRESSSWMYLYRHKDGSTYKYGELLDIALKNSKWKEENGTVTITGKDSRTKENVEIIIKFQNGDMDFANFKKGDKETTSFTSFYGWLYNYADIERNNGR